MRIFNAILLLGALAACHHNAAPPPTDVGDKIDCAVGPNAQMAHVCSVERTASADGDLILILHHPDGGFRQLLVTRDGPASWRRMAHRPQPLPRSTITKLRWSSMMTATICPRR